LEAALMASANEGDYDFDRSSQIAKPTAWELLTIPGREKPSWLQPLIVLVIPVSFLNSEFSRLLRAAQHCRLFLVYGGLLVLSKPA
jgi:hypothetical protein